LKSKSSKVKGKKTLVLPRKIGKGKAFDIERCVKIREKAKKEDPCEDVL